MKSLSLAFLLFGITIVAQANILTPQQQDVRMQEIAKKIRRQYYVEGYEDVSSSIEKMTAQKLQAHLNPVDGIRYESELDESEIAELYTCLEAHKSCALYLITVGSSFYSGYGIDAHFIMLNLNNSRYEEVRHTIYAE